jgi:hypothetical protein
VTFPSVVNRANGTEAGDLFSFTVPIPGAAGPGDLFLIVEACRFGGTVTWPAGWLEVLAPVVSSSNEAAARKKVLTAADIATGSVTPTKNFHGQAAWSSYLIRGAAGVEGSGCVDTTPNPPSLTPSWGVADTLWICMSTDRGSNNDFSSYPANYGNGLEGGVVGSDIWLATAERQLAAASEDPGAFGWSFAILQQAGTIAVQPAAGRGFYPDGFGGGVG